LPRPVEQRVLGVAVQVNEAHGPWKLAVPSGAGEGDCAS